MASKNSTSKELYLVNPNKSNVISRVSKMDLSRISKQGAYSTTKAI